MLDEQEEGLRKPFTIPTNLDDWTWETVTTLVKKHDYEPSLYDFKRALHQTEGDKKAKEDHNDSIRRTACSMANTNGGFIIFGILDRQKKVDHPEQRIVGIPDGDLRKEFGEKVSCLQPEIYFDTVFLRHPDDEKKGVFVVFIPHSPRRPHMFLSSESGIYYRRGNGGSAEIMNHYEVREQMLYAEGRLQRVTLFRLEITQYLELIQVMLSEGNVVGQTHYRFDTSAYKVLLADICDLLPASENLLPLLLKIPLEANKINRAIEFVNSMVPVSIALGGKMREPYETSAGSIKHYLEVLRDICVGCQGRLEHIFGKTGSNS